jgi:hypothetical protein
MDMRIIFTFWEKMDSSCKCEDGKKALTPHNKVFVQARIFRNYK